MGSLTLAVAGFVLGLIFASLQPVTLVLKNLPPIHKANDMIMARGYPPVCFDSYAHWPLSLARNVKDMKPVNALPGLAHVSLSSRTHTGNRGMELWHETVQPGSGTPIHSHNMEEAAYVLSGTAAVFIQAKDGRVISQQLEPNGFITIYPNAKHQIVSQGTEPLVMLAVMDNPPMRPVVFQNWEDTKGGEFAPLPWDADCTNAAPDPTILLKKGSNEDANAASKASEL